MNKITKLLVNKITTKKTTTSKITTCPNKITTTKSNYLGKLPMQARSTREKRKGRMECIMWRCMWWLV